MKSVGLSVLAMMAISNVSFAGGDFTKPVEPEILIPVVDDSVSGFYVGLGLSAVSTRESSLDFSSVENGQDRTGDIVLLAGYDFNEYLAVEGRYMTSIAEEDILDRTSWGIFAKPQYPVTEDFKVYGLLGYGGFDASGTNHSGLNIDADDTGFQWGLGVSYEVFDGVSVFADYLNIARDVTTTAFVTPNVDIDSDAFTVGVTYHF